MENDPTLDSLREALREKTLQEKTLKLREISRRLPLLSDGSLVTIGSLDDWRSGRVDIPEEMRAPLQAILAAAPKKAQNPSSTHEVDGLKPPHEVFREMRFELGRGMAGGKMTAAELAAAIAPHLPSREALSASYILRLEAIPGPGEYARLPNLEKFAGTDAITAYGEVFKATGDDNKIDWFNENAEEFRQSLLTAMVERRTTLHGASSRWNMSRIPQGDNPGDKPAFWDDYIARRKAAATPDEGEKLR